MTKKMILFSFFMGCILITYLIQSFMTFSLNKTYQIKYLDISGRKLAIYTKENNKNILTIFESGLGDSSDIWKKNNLIKEISQFSDIVVYDRAGYGKSDDFQEKSIADSSSDLGKIIGTFGTNKKIILVGHSLGGMIIRDYVIKNPHAISGILLLDPAHEDFNSTKIQEVKKLFPYLPYAFWMKGMKHELLSIPNDLEYMAKLPHLPSIPTVVLTGKYTQKTQTDQELWYDSHEKLGTHVPDFTHIVTESGHYIMLETPEKVLESYQLLLSHL